MNKSIRRLSALLLALLIVFSLSACGGAPDLDRYAFDVTPEFLAGYAEENGAKKYDDLGEFTELVLKGDHFSEEYADGGYIAVTGKALVDLINEKRLSSAFNTQLEYNSDMKSGTLYCIGTSKELKSNQLSNKSLTVGWTMDTLSIEFADADSAAEFYSQAAEEVKNKNALPLFRSDFNEGKSGSSACMTCRIKMFYSNIGTYEGIYLKDNCVLLLVGAEIRYKGLKSAFKSICKSADIPNPMK